jgi:hypothetical protein
MKFRVHFSQIKVNMAYENPDNIGKYSVLKDDVEEDVDPA